ncbi:hypothetical protein D7X30_23660 [Corallococcus sp. AB011P]|nr:hypothetical protein D7X30_23660 [Corallococcus sp. AB011P]
MSRVPAPTSTRGSRPSVWVTRRRCWTRSGGGSRTLGVHVMVNDKSPLRAASELAQSGRTAEAIDCLEAALALTRSDKERPADTSLLARTAGLHCEVAGRLSQAARYYEEAIATADPEPLLLIAWASVLWRSGQADSARSSLASAESLARSLSDADALTMVANIRAEWASDDR